MEISKSLLVAAASLALPFQLTAGSVVYFDASANAGGDGSWSSPYATIADAVANCDDGGEVRVKSGLHVLSAAEVVISKSIKIIGGWTADGIRTEEPSATIVCGDVSRNDVYLDLGGTEIGPVVDANGKLIEFRAPTAAEVCWRLDASKRTDNLKYFVKADSTSAVGSFAHRIEGLTLTGFGQNLTGCVYYGGSSASLTMTNCWVVGNYALSARGAAVQIETDGPITDCKFLGNNGAAVVYGSGNALKTGVTSTLATIANCEFAYGYADQTVNNVIGCGVICYAKLAHLFVRDCTFAWLYADVKGTAQGPAVVLAALTGTSYVDGVQDCTFENLTMKSVNTSVPTLVNGNHGPMSGCTFENCSLDTSGFDNGTVYLANIAGAITDCTFRNNSICYESSGSLGTVALSNQTQVEQKENVYLGNTVEGVNCQNVYLFNLPASIGFGSTQAPITGLDVCNNTLKGGTAITSLFQCSSFCFLNAMIVGNKAEGYGTDCVASTFRRASISYLLWSTVYNNDFPIEFYGYQNKNNHQVYANSSIIWRDASLGEYTVSESLLMSKGQIVIRHVCMSGVKEGDECIGATGTGASNTIGLFTDDPKFAPSLQTEESGRVYAVLSRQSPYKRSGYYPLRSLDDTASNAKTGSITFDCAENGYREVANNTNYHTNSKPQTEESVVDFLGAERIEGSVALGAVQQLYRNDVLILSIR